jgi:hypothetical protein
MALFTLHTGQRFRSDSKRRYLVVAYRSTDIRTPEGIYVKYVHVLRHSDSLETALKAARKEADHYRRLPHIGVKVLVFDTQTGQETPVL